MVERAEEAANQLKITATDLLSLKVVDQIVAEPAGGAHQDADAAEKLCKARSP